MADLKFSIIIPIYNAEATLRRCLDSLVGQQFSDYELRLINDGSTDDSDAICREYANTYSCVRYFAKENGGVSSARNLGLEHTGCVKMQNYISKSGRCKLKIIHFGRE